MALTDTARQMPPRRSEIVHAEIAAGDQKTVETPLSLIERITSSEGARKLFIVSMLALAWELYGRHLGNDLIFPTFGQTLQAWWESVSEGTLTERTLTSLRVLSVAYVIGVVLATGLTIVAVSSRIGTDLLSTLTAMFNPLPAIALLPLALLWFGIGPVSIIFVVVHSVLWAVALNMHTGFLAVAETLRMSGRNVGLKGFGYVVHILIPAAFPAILAGLKIGWAFAWRTLIAAELVFGVSSRSGGLGWFILENRNQLQTAHVFAGLLTVILIGLAVESGIFRLSESRTLARWGMQR